MPNYDLFSEKEAATTHHCAVARHQLRIRTARTRDFASAAAAVLRTDGGGGGGESDSRATSFSGPNQNAVREEGTIPGAGLPLFNGLF